MARLLPRLLAVNDESLHRQQRLGEQLPGAWSLPSRPSGVQAAAVE